MGSDGLALTSMKVPCLLDQPDTSRRRDYAGNVSVALDLTGTSMREVYRSRQFHDFEHYGFEKAIIEALMVPFSMIMGYELSDRVSQHILTEENHLIEAAFFDVRTKHAA